MPFESGSFKPRPRGGGKMIKSIESSIKCVMSDERGSTCAVFFDFGNVLDIHNKRCRPIENFLRPLKFKKHENQNIFGTYQLPLE